VLKILKLKNTNRPQKLKPKKIGKKKEKKKKKKPV